VVYCRTVHCFQKIWFNKRTHPNEHPKWAPAVNKIGADQLSVSSQPMKYSIHQYSMLMHILGNWLLANTAEWWWNQWNHV